jgi:tetratricopeptide (TPR) repeat protein
MKRIYYYLIVFLCAAIAHAQSYTKTEDVSIRLTSGDKATTVTACGFSKTFIVIKAGSGTSTATSQIDISQIDSAWFTDLRINYGDVATYTRKKQWKRAFNFMFSSLKPYLPYLNLPDNNAIDSTYQMATYLMYECDKNHRFAETPEQKEYVASQYEYAYNLYRYLRRADWTYYGLLSELNGIKCLIRMGKLQTAEYKLAALDKPVAGDISMGIYWLNKSYIAWEQTNYPSAMDAAVMSVDFENKDVDTFPDALLMTAQCYGKLGNWYRARDVYYEIAKIFPNTEWEETALLNLKDIMDKQLTEKEEKMPLENVFFGFSEDIN